MEAEPDETYYYLFPIIDTEGFRPDTIEKCALLFERLGEIATEVALDYPGKCILIAWEAPNDR